MPTIATDLPMKDAVEMLTRKVPVGSGMDSREWALLPAEIKLRAMFSAKVESERLLVEMQERLQARMELAKREGRHVTRSVFIEEMRQEVIDSGYKKPGGVKRGSLRDLRSTRRLGLIFDMNVSQAQGYARWLTDMTPGMLAAAPAQELIRVMQRVEIRDWPLIWQEHGGKFYGEPGPDYPNAPGRMIALKTDPIWRWISRFKTPWPPFDWGSGMGLKNVRRPEALSLGLIKSKQILTPLKHPFNEGARMNIKTLPEAARKRILDALAGDVEIVGDEVRLMPPERKDAMSPRREPTGWKPSGIVTSSAPRADGRSLLEKVTLEETISYRDLSGRIERTLTLANEVIGGGNLPEILTRFGSPLVSARASGLYVPTAKANPNPIWVRDDMPDEAGFAELTWLHELGHFIDNLGLHTPQPDAFYASEDYSGLRGVMKEILRSVAAERLIYNYGPNDRDATPREFFARAFAQHIAEESADPDLTNLLLKWRSGAFERAGWPQDLQWHRADFKSIRKALRVLFARNGWKGGDQ